MTYEWHLDRYRLGALPLDFGLCSSSGLRYWYAWILSGLDLGTGVKIIFTFFFVFLSQVRLPFDTRASRRESSISCT
jgi:hypothetical protein